MRPERPFTESFNFKLKQSGLLTCLSDISLSFCKYQIVQKTMFLVLAETVTYML